MARKISDNDKALLIADHKTGKYSQRKLAEKYDVSLGTVSKLTKEEDKSNERFVEAQVAILEGKANLSDIEMNAVMNTAQDEIRRRNLIFNASERIVAKATLMIDEISEAQELKHLCDTVDKASLTLGVNQRHSNQNINVNTQNNMQQNTNVEITKDLVQETLEEFENGY